MITLTFVMKEDTWWKCVRKWLQESEYEWDYDNWVFKYASYHMTVLKLDVNEGDAVEITKKINDILIEKREL